MSFAVGRRHLLAGGAMLGLPGRLWGASASAAPAQPFLAHARRVAAALAALGEPIADWDARIGAALASGGIAAAAIEAERLLDGRSLLSATISPEARVGTLRGAAVPELVQGGWRLFLLRIDNPARVPGRIGVTSPEAAPPHAISVATPHVWDQRPPPGEHLHHGDVEMRWLAVDPYDGPLLPLALDDLEREYRILQLYARDAGRLSATFVADLGPGTQDLGGRASAAMTFSVRPSRTVEIRVRDHDGRPTTCSLMITDAQGRIYPAQAKRSAPDFFFQQRIYRADGETLSLPTGSYTVSSARGPEYLIDTRERGVAETGPASWSFDLKRWIDPAARGWYSGDHHLHAAGCAHYASPEDGVGPEVMIPQVAGEALSIGAVLIWGPGYAVQKRHFSGRDDPVSSASAKLHYDLEISMFPSSASGHLALLGLKTQDYPGAATIADWPSWTGPILAWAKAQGALTGYAHSGNGLWAGTSDLPNYAAAPFDGIGANEFIATVTEGLVDFIGIGNTVPAAELNIWYHVLNSGFRPRIAGETDWPCIYDQAVGMARSYVKLDGPLSYAGWCAGLAAGRSYVSDGRAHLIDIAARAGGKSRAIGRGDLALAAPEPVTVEALVAARLEPQPTPATEAIRKLETTAKPHWHLERARLGDSRSVSVELIVNGIAVESRVVPADQVLRPIAFTFTPRQSCWVALRIAEAAHSNPIWIMVADKPVRVAASANWCAEGVARCWAQKGSRIRGTEHGAAQAMYDRAAATYRRRAQEAQA